MLLNDTAQVKLPLIGVSTKSNGPIYVNPQLSTGYAASRTEPTHLPPDLSAACSQSFTVQCN